MTDILQEAGELINGQRAQDYGDVGDNFQRIADLWFAYRYDNLEEPFTPHDVAMMMVLVKVARQSNGHHRDSDVDIAGYAALDAKLHPEGPTFTLKFEKTPPTQDFWDDIDASVLQAQEKRERDRTSRPPRVWESRKDIPSDVRVRALSGEVWSWHEEELSWLWKSDGHTIDYGSVGTAPYTEILDIEPEGSE